MVSLEFLCQYEGNIVDLFIDIEQFIVELDQVVCVVIDENFGIIVMGQDVKVFMVVVV